MEIDICAILLGNLVRCAKNLVTCVSRFLLDALDCRPESQVSPIAALFRICSQRLVQPNTLRAKPSRSIMSNFFRDISLAFAVSMATRSVVARE